MLLDRGEIEKFIEDARSSLWLGKKPWRTKSWNPVNLAIVMVTAAQRLQRGEVASALSLARCFAFLLRRFLFIRRCRRAEW